MPKPSVSLITIVALFALTPHLANAADLNPHVLPGHLPLWANQEADEGSAAPDLQLNNLVVVLKRPAQQETAFRQFLARQQDPHSSDFHHWLTSREIGERFGPSLHDIAALTGWLQSSGLQVDGVANSRMFVRFSGRADATAAAFKSEIHYYQIPASRNGTRLARPLLSIASEPTIPASLANLVGAISGLSEVPTSSGAQGRALPKTALPRYTSCSSGTCEHYIAPADFATIFDVNPLYNAGINGAGQTIAIVGRSRVANSDIQAFQLDAGLTNQTPNVIIPPTGTDPGATANEDQLEASIDVERAVGTAPGATIDLIVSASAASQDGIYIAALYAVDVKMDPILSISFGACESATSSAANPYDTLAQQAAGEGISFFVISGDSGVAGCDTYLATPPATQTAGPNYICVSSYITCVGGTEFNDTANPGQYWTSSNATSLSSALSYIPEGAWNEPVDNGTYEAAASGGGPSAHIPKPSWQTGIGVPNDGFRDTPDIALPASAHDGYYGCLAYRGGDCNTGRFEYFYGTSASTPTMAGIAALINQKLGARQGNLNPSLYQLAASTPSVFHDTTIATSGVTNCSTATPSICNNSTPSANSLSGGLAGYELTTGYDLVTGLGSVDVAKLVTALTPVPGFGLSNSGALTVAPGAVTGNSVTITLTPSGGFTGSVTLSCAVTTTVANVQHLPTCSLPPTVAITGTTPVTATLAVLTTAPSSAMALPPKSFFGGGAALVCASLFLIPGRRKRFLMPATLLAAALLCTISCGGTGSSPTPTPVTQPGTTAGAYTVTVTGVAASQTETTSVSVSVN